LLTRLDVLTCYCLNKNIQTYMKTSQADSTVCQKENPSDPFYNKISIEVYEKKENINFL